MFTYREYLMNVSLSNNRLRACPPEIWACVSLRTLNLSHNLLKDIPNETEGSLVTLKEYGLMELVAENCTELESLDLSHNLIETVPEELGNCGSLKRLILSHNRLKKIFEGCARLNNLIELDISGNQIEKVPDKMFETLEELRVLNLNDNSLKTLGGEFQTLTKLNELMISGNYFEEIPWQIYKLNLLRKLHAARNEISHLPRNKFTGAPEIGKLERLEDLDISNNQFSEIGNEIGECKHLRRLVVSSNRIVVLPKSLANCRKLEVLDISENAIREIPCSLVENLGSLLEFYASRNDITTLPSELNGLIKLKNLRLDMNRIREISDSFGSSLSSIRELEIRGNEITKLPRGISGLTGLTTLCLSPNKLKHLPATVGCLEQLTRLDVSHNELTSIDSKALPPKLRYLDLSHNSLESLPEEIGRLENLIELRLDHNKLNKLPRNTGNLSSLRELFLQHNKLQELPSSMSMLSNMTGCNLAHNKFAGTPSQFTDSNTWIYCDMTGNASGQTQQNEKMQEEAMRTLFFFFLYVYIILNNFFFHILYIHIGTYCEAMHQVQINRPNDAIRTLNMLLDQNSTCVGSRDDDSTRLRGLALELRARALSRIDRVSDAVNDMNAAEELLESLSSETLLLRAWLLRRLSEPVQALLDLNRLIHRQPEMYVAYVRRARLRFECGQFRAAKSDLRCVLSLGIFEIQNEENKTDDDDDNGADNDDGTTYQNRNGQNADEIHRVSGLDPFDCFMLMGHIYMKLKQHNKAMESYVHASRWRPSRPEGHLYLGITLQRRKEHKKALACLCNAERLLDVAERFNDEVDVATDSKDVANMNSNVKEEGLNVKDNDTKDNEEGNIDTKDNEKEDQEEEEKRVEEEKNEEKKEEKSKEQTQVEDVKIKVGDTEENVVNTTDTKEEDISINEDKLIDTNCIEQALSKSSFISSSSKIKEKTNNEKNNSKTQKKMTRRNVLRYCDIRYCNELRRRLLMRRQMTYCELGKMKLARSDWNKTVELDQTCNQIQEMERENDSAPNQDDMFLCSFGEIERPTFVAAPWKPSTTMTTKMVSQSENFWKDYMKSSVENQEMRRFASAISIQSAIRGHFGRVIVKQTVQAKRLQAWYRGAHIRRVQRLNRCATQVQSAYRGYRGRQDSSRRSRLAFAVDTVLHQVKEHETILSFISKLVDEDEDIRISLLDQEDHRILTRKNQIDLYTKSLQYCHEEVKSRRWSIVDDAELDVKEAGMRARRHAEESADRYVSERKPKCKSSLSICNILAGGPPDIPKPISSLRLGTFSKMMYEEFSSQRSRKGKSEAHTAAYASLVASYAATHALSCASVAKMSVLISDIHTQIVESDRVKMRAKEMNAAAVTNQGNHQNDDDNDDDDDRAAMTAQICVAVANQAQIVAEQASKSAMRNAYVAYRRMTVKIRERKLCVLWKTPSSRQDIEMIELSRGCPIVEMAKTRDGWSWIVYEPKKQKRRRGRRKVKRDVVDEKRFDENVLHLGVVPTEYCTVQNKSLGRAAHATYAFRSYQHRDVSVETPALRRDRTMDVLQVALLMLKPCLDDAGWNE